MTPFDRLTPEEKAEVDSAIIDAYTENGAVLPRSEAVERFDGFVADAVQAHRPWAALLLDEWRRAGETAFIAERWKKLGGQFRLTANGRTRQRPMVRGTRKPDDVGVERWVQESLLSWTAEQLERAIVEAARRIEEERANIAAYRTLLDLLRETGRPTVAAALDAVGRSLDEFLAERAA